MIFEMKKTLWIFQKIINFVKNPRPFKEKLNKIGFIYNYEIIYI